MPATDPPLLDPWFRLSFGQQHAYGVRETGAASAPADAVDIRNGDDRDVDFLSSLDLMLYEHQRGPPTFSGRARREIEESRAEIGDELSWPEAAHFIAERRRTPLAGMILTRTRRDFVREGCIDLSFAATVPDARGTGVMTALTNHALRWAAAAGYSAISTDWRVTNLLSSRFWPSRGFRPVFLRLARSIP